MNKNSSDKKTAIMILVTFAVVIIVLLIIEFVPGIKYHEKTSKELLLEKYAALNNEYGDYIAANGDLYPEEVLTWCGFGEGYNEDDMMLVYNYPAHVNDYDSMSFTDEELNCKEIPALYMTDTRWGYEYDGDGTISRDGCAAVSITMANLYLNHNSEVDPVKVMDYAYNNDYIGFSGGIRSRHISDVLEHFGLKNTEHNFDKDEGGSGELTEAELKNALDKENTAVMAAMYGETFSGHAIIIRGYDENGFYINDPGDREKTEKVWKFDELKGELMRYWEINA
ncbi:MAG: C39 family peptidase [Oscillospiraceae bacterium]|nr:C39 family peptidase [Oscillospiraceae bacterium]